MYRGQAGSDEGCGVAWGLAAVMGSGRRGLGQNKLSSYKKTVTKYVRLRFAGPVLHGRPPKEKEPRRGSCLSVSLCPLTRA